MPPSHQSVHAVPTTHSTSRKILTVLAIAIFFTAMALLILQNILGPFAPSFLRSYNQGYVDGYRTALEEAGGVRIAESGLPLTAITGEVLSLSGNTLRIHAQGLFMDERIDGVGAERTVTIADNATVEIQTLLSPTEYARQLQAIGPIRPENPPSNAPTPFTSKEGSLSDISVGDLVTVTSQDGVDIRMSKSFVASSVVIAIPFETPTPPEPVPVPSPTAPPDSEE